MEAGQYQDLSCYANGQGAAPRAARFRVAEDIPAYLGCQEDKGRARNRSTGIRTRGSQGPQRSQYLYGPNVCSFQGCFPSVASIWAAARRLNAAMVSVGLAVAEVGKTAEPRMKRLGWSWLRRSRSTTECFRVVAHARRADDVPSAFGGIAMLDLGGAELRRRSDACASRAAARPACT